METTVVAISGMTCMGCVSSVKRVLGGIAGVAQVEVSLEKARAEISYDPGKTCLQTIKAAITDAGYEVA